MRCSAVGPVPAGGSRVQRSALLVPLFFSFSFFFSCCVTAAGAGWWQPCTEVCSGGKSVCVFCVCFW
jgi:hypothetical protein